MTKRDSGGKRAADKKRASRDAARNRAGDDDYAARWSARYDEVAREAPREPAKAYAWLARVMLLAIEETMLDPGLAPEHRREQLGRLVAQGAKVIDPAQMAQRIDKLERALREAD